MMLARMNQELLEMHRTGNVCLDFSIVLPAEGFLPLGVLSTTPAQAAVAGQTHPMSPPGVALGQVHPHSSTLSLDQSP